jgi:hypothetical protein
LDSKGNSAQSSSKSGQIYNFVLLNGKILFQNMGKILHHQWKFEVDMSTTSKDGVSIDS